MILTAERSTLDANRTFIIRDSPATVPPPVTGPSVLRRPRPTRPKKPSLPRAQAEKIRADLARRESRKAWWREDFEDEL